MYKKIFITFLLVFMFFPFTVFGEELIPNSTSGILMEASTGKIIYEKDKDKEVSIASMTKMVAQIIILEEIDKGNIKWSDKVTISENAASMGGSQIYLSPGEEITIDDLMKGISVASGNDATVAMAEVIAGSESKFVELMNKKVKSLGLKHTVFKNCTGLDEEGHYSTAYDQAVIARYLINNHPTILDYSSIYEDYLREDTENKFWLVNTNKLIRFYDGADGLKTGHTDNAGYCLTATMEKNNMRLISIVMGEDSKDNRTNDTISMMEYGFNNYGSQTIINKNDYSKIMTINNAKDREVKYYLKDNVNMIVNKSDNNVNYKIKEYLYDVKAPLNKNTKVGELKITYDNNIYSYDLIVKEDIYKNSFINVFNNLLKDIIGGVKINN